MNLSGLKNPLVPLAILLLLIGMHVIRWDKEASFKPNEVTQVVVNVDRWSNEKWIDTFVYSVVSKSTTFEERPVKDGFLEAEGYRNTLTYIWDGLFALSFLWLIFTLMVHKKEVNPNA